MNPPRSEFCNNAEADGNGVSVVTDSTLTLARNDAGATARGNVVSNEMTVDALNLTAGVGGIEAGASWIGGEYTSSATAAHTVVSHQMNQGEISALSDLTATVNLAGGNMNGNTVDASTLAVTGNRSIADAAANVASNRLNLEAGVDGLATGAVSNNQINVASVTSQASSQTGISLNDTMGGSDRMADSSTMTVSGNQTVARANGNVSSNVLTASGLSLGEGIAPASNTFAGGTGTGTNTTISGLDMGVLNAQSNSAGITAQVTSANHTASASNPGFAALNGTSTAVSGNLVQASAAGNTATNRIDLTALNHSGGSAGIASSQVNTGAILASVSGAQRGSVVTGTIASGSMYVGGNVITASAMGNSVVSTLIRD